MTEPSGSERLRELAKRIRPKHEYCSTNGESHCRDHGLPEDRSCSGCNRWRWADELDALIEALAARPAQEAPPEVLLALKRLRNEVAGLLGSVRGCLQQLTGVTNVRVLEQREREARAVIERAQEARPASIVLDAARQHYRDAAAWRSVPGGAYFAANLARVENRRKLGEAIDQLAKAEPPAEQPQPAKGGQS